MTAAQRSTLRRRLDSLVTYLPLVMMALLAGFSWWLVRVTPEPEAPDTTQAVRHDPDYFAQRFTIERFDAAGALRSWMVGDEMRHYPDVDQFVVDRIRLRSTESLGKREAGDADSPAQFRVEASADQGQSDATGSVIELRGNAHVTRQPIASTGNRDKLDFKGNEVRLLINGGQVVSDQPVDITQNGSRFTASSMDYDHDSSQLELKGRVRGTILPPERKP